MPGQLHKFTDLLQDWREDTLNFLRHDAPKIVVVLLVSFILIQLLRVITSRLKAFSIEGRVPTAFRAQQLRTLSGVVYSTGVFIIIFLALLQILPLLGVNMGPLLASAGIAGLAIGFGAQTLVKDVINGFFILMENQYEVGDVVRIAGVQGTVEHMTLRETVVRDDQGALSTIPNSQVTIVANLTRDWAQVALHIQAAYSEDSERVVNLLQQVGQELANDPQFRDLLVADPQVPGIDRVGSGEVDYLMLVKTKPGSQYVVSRELRRRIKECFQKQDIKPGGAGRVYVVDNPAPPAPAS